MSIVRCRICNLPIEASKDIGVGHKCRKLFKDSSSTIKNGPIENPLEVEVEKKSKNSDKYVNARLSLVPSSGEDLPESARHIYHDRLKNSDIDETPEKEVFEKFRLDVVMDKNNPEVIVSGENILTSIACFELRRKVKSGAMGRTIALHIQVKFLLCKKNQSDENFRIIEGKYTPYNIEKDYGEPYFQIELKEGEKFFNIPDWEKIQARENILFNDNLNRAIENAVIGAERESELLETLTPEQLRTRVKKIIEEVSLDCNNGFLDGNNTSKYLLDGKNGKGVESIVKGKSLSSNIEGFLKDKESFSKSLNGKINGKKVTLNKQSKEQIASRKPRLKKEDPLENYSQEYIRKGSPINLTEQEHYDHLSQNWGLRGVQYGNTVTDKMRLEKSALLNTALTDLRDTLGLKDKEVSLNGTLGLGIGSRLRGGFGLSTYDINDNILVVTRKSDLGNLSKEWANALYENNKEKFKPLDGIKNKEVFIEEMIKYKMSKKGITNTYLNSRKDESLNHTKESLGENEAIFDKILRSCFE